MRAVYPAPAQRRSLVSEAYLISFKIKSFMDNDIKDPFPDMIHFECPVIKRLWEHSGVPAGEDEITQFLCQVVWECPRLLKNGNACGVCGAFDHNAIRDLDVYLKI